ncbi:hypothetical protein HMPREF0658_1144 [Hoylesella marshii DSM 16973 = JCM 13450]|uniref:Uncharacterized protein n=1 Tax=Hoylesella marshii DSM 16973 = JCM 13450 TaxID=862515 RepID=E0NSJ3_9BACT|nr:hypothetical protein HMPREF0658_1144 [Hoylesella marshii DSM 16973 = JCM 13450]
MREIIVNLCLNQGDKQLKKDGTKRHHLQKNKIAQSHDCAISLKNLYNNTRTV